MKRVLQELEERSLRKDNLVTDNQLMGLGNINFNSLVPVKPSLIGQQMKKAPESLTLTDSGSPNELSVMVP